MNTTTTKAARAARIEEGRRLLAQGRDMTTLDLDCLTSDELDAMAKERALFLLGGDVAPQDRPLLFDVVASGSPCETIWSHGPQWSDETLYAIIPFGGFWKANR